MERRDGMALWLATVAVVAVAIPATAEVHRFSPEWRGVVEASLTPREVMALGKPEPIAGSPSEFTVRIASEALMPSFVRSIVIRTAGSEGEATEAQGNATALLVVKPAGDASASVSLERMETGDYRVAAKDQDRLADWLRSHVEALDAGHIAVDAISWTTGSAADVVVDLQPPGPLASP